MALLAELEYVSDIPYKGHVEKTRVFSGNYENFSIHNDNNMVVHPPKYHLVELRSGISEVIKELKKGSKDYHIIKEVPVERVVDLPARYKFFHTRWAGQDKLGIQELYPHREECKEIWYVGDTFHGGYMLPEDIQFLEELLALLRKMKTPSKKQLEKIREDHIPGCD
jgi:hypothetical protein